MQPIDGRPSYPYMDDEQRKVACDAYVSWQGSRYSVPWLFAGKEVGVRGYGDSVEVRHGAECIAMFERFTGFGAARLWFLSGKVML
jgi:hypothetical protein